MLKKGERGIRRSLGKFSSLIQNMTSQLMQAQFECHSKFISTIFLPILIFNDIVINSSFPVPTSSFDISFDLHYFERIPDFPHFLIVRIQAPRTLESFRFQSLMFRMHSVSLSPLFHPWTLPLRFSSSLLILPQLPFLSANLSRSATFLSQSGLQ